MTYNDLKKLNSNAAMELLTDKMKEARDTLHPMLICGEMPEMDKLLEWMNLASLSKAFALSVLQEEVEATGDTGRLRPAGHAAIQLYQDAEWLEGPSRGCIEGMFQGASDVIDCLFDDEEDEPDYPEEMNAALSDLQKAVEEANLLEEGEMLCVAAIDSGSEPEIFEGQRLISYDDKIAVYMEAAKKAMIAAGAIAEDMELVLIAGLMSDADDDCCCGCIDEVLTMVNLENLAGDDAKAAYAMADILEQAGCLTDGRDLVVGYLEDAEEEDDEEPDEDAPEAVLSLTWRDGRTLVVMA